MTGPLQPADFAVGEVILVLKIDDLRTYDGRCLKAKAITEKIAVALGDTIKFRFGPSGQNQLDGAGHQELVIIPASATMILTENQLNDLILQLFVLHSNTLRLSFQRELATPVSDGIGCSVRHTRRLPLHAAIAASFAARTLASMKALTSHKEMGTGPTSSNKALRKDATAGIVVQEFDEMAMLQDQGIKNFKAASEVSLEYEYHLCKHGILNEYLA